jgi:hypothetical protein
VQIAARIAPQGISPLCPGHKRSWKRICTQRTNHTNCEKCYNWKNLQETSTGGARQSNHRVSGMREAMSFGQGHQEKAAAFYRIYLFELSVHLL